MFLLKIIRRNKKNQAADKVLVYKHKMNVDFQAKIYI